MPSVLEPSAEKTAKRALAFVEKEAGGITTAHGGSASALPCGRQQVDDIMTEVLSRLILTPYMQ